MAGKSGERPNESRGIIGPIAGRTMGAIGRSISNPGSPILAQGGEAQHECEHEA